jgi:hypothetical protein
LGRRGESPILIASELQLSDWALEEPTHLPIQWAKDAEPLDKLPSQQRLDKVAFDIAKTRLSRHR